MAEKESTVYIVDVGSSMGSTQVGRDVSDLDFAMTYIWDKITSTVALDRKTATLGVVGLRTDGWACIPLCSLHLVDAPEDTENELSHEESFEHISVLHEISKCVAFAPFL